MRVEVAYALPAEQVLLAVEVADGAMVRAAIEQSGILGRFPGIDLVRDKVGVFGREVSLQDRLMPGDRVEIYRALTVDPNEARRARAKAAQRRKKGLSS